MKIAVIGAGAAGLMCACMLSTVHDVVVFDRNAEVGKKLLLTGNGRCNLTNLVKPDKFLESVSRGREFISSALDGFTPNDTVEFFRTLGVETVVEDDNRVFPKTGKAGAIRQALESYARSRGVQFKLGEVVADIHTILSEFDAVIVATGGASHPKTGSTGDGYEFARQLGHTVIPTRPSLCGLQFARVTGFQGTSVTVGATLCDHTETGDIMFTKNGVSGPVIFRLTSKLAGHSVHGESLVIDFVPHIDKPMFDAGDKPFYAFRKYLPQTVANWLVGLGFKPRDIKQVRVQLADFAPIETATITRGGVDTSQIDHETMQSKLVPNVYFIGEVLDVDALSGGFNLQIALSTAVACAKHIDRA